MRLFPAVLAALFFLVMSIAQPAGALGFTVTNFSDSGPGSLRQAITDANASPGADTVNFNVGGKSTTSGTIVLTAALPTITDSLTIQGPGASLLTIDANAKGRALRITAPNKTVDISGLTFINGFASTGGAITADSGTVSLHDLVFTGNKTTTTGGDGGAVSAAGSLTVTNVVFRGNSATFGGALSTDGSVVVSNSQFLNNSVAGTIGTILTGQGGAIYASGSLTLQNSTVSGNSAPNDIGGGVVSDTRFVNRVRVPGSLTITNSHIDNNSSFGGGGGIYSYNAATISGSTVNGNTTSNIDSSYGGGGLFSLGGGLITDSSVNGNTAKGLDVVGGGIYVCANTCDNTNPLVIQRSTLSNNSAVWGGGVGDEFGSSLVIDESTLSGNRAVVGGAIYNETDMVLQNSTLNGNTVTDLPGAPNARSAAGGGVFTRIGSTQIEPPLALIQNSTISGNTATSEDGRSGGIEITQQGRLVMYNVTIADNKAPIGGGISADSALTIYNSIVANNQAPQKPNCDFTVTVRFSYDLTNEDSCQFFGFWSLSNTDPKLGPLANNGGPTLTYLPRPDSPAIDSGANLENIPSRDQRGVTRDLNFVIPDIGSVEVTLPDIHGVDSKSLVPAQPSAVATQFLDPLARMKASLSADTTPSTGPTLPFVPKAPLPFHWQHESTVQAVVSSLPSLITPPVTPPAPVPPVTTPEAQPSTPSANTAPSKKG